MLRRVTFRAEHQQPSTPRPPNGPPAVADWTHLSPTSLRTTCRGGFTRRVLQIVPRHRFASHGRVIGRSARLLRTFFEAGAFSCVAAR